jgi:hypothetical protein
VVGAGAGSGEKGDSGDVGPGGQRWGGREGAWVGGVEGDDWVMGPMGPLLLCVCPGLMTMEAATVPDLSMSMRWAVRRLLSGEDDASIANMAMLRIMFSSAGMGGNPSAPAAQTRSCSCQTLDGAILR